MWCGEAEFGAANNSTDLRAEKSQHMLVIEMLITGDHNQLRR
jgi:hypothetical protein